jgi:hypothetical protein
VAGKARAIHTGRRGRGGHNGALLVDALPERAEQEGGGVLGGAVVALAVLTEAEQNGVDGHLVHLHVTGERGAGPSVLERRWTCDVLFEVQTRSRNRHVIKVFENVGCKLFSISCPQSFFVNVCPSS